MHNSGYPGQPAGVHYRVGTHAVGDHEILGAGDRSIDVALGREVEHGVVSFDRLREGVQIANVGVHEPKAAPAGVLDVTERGAVPGVGQGVVDGHLVVAVPHDPPNVVGPDEAGATGDQESHRPKDTRGANWPPGTQVQERVRFAIRTTQTGVASPALSEDRCCSDPLP